MQKRVMCLYRVSTKGQVEDNDIPMQKQFCRDFIRSKAADGWIFEDERSEKGVSGFKVSAKDRDAIQELQGLALQGKFEVLLVFMFDRLGRRDDETPFIVEWFAQNGIEVWSATEGQQRFDNHVDKLMNYIRFWQASGESIKTSIRTKTRLAQIVQEGKFRGGVAPYGYRLVKKGRLGKKNRELNDIEIDEAEAIVIKKMFDLCVNHGYGGRRIASSLAEDGHYNRRGEMFHYTTIQNILKNPMYIGILRSGETRSEVFSQLQIIDVDTFEQTKKIMDNRRDVHEGNIRFPRHTVSMALLSGNIYCAQCGGRMFATTARKSQRQTSQREGYDRVPIYKCYNRTQNKGVCPGPTTYRALKIDEVIEAVLSGIFSRVKGTRESDLLNEYAVQKLAELKLQLRTTSTERAKLVSELKSMEAAMVSAIDGKAGFTPAQLSRRMTAVETLIEEKTHLIEQIDKDLSDQTALLNTLSQDYSRFVSWADIFNEADISVKKMIVSNMIRRVTVGQGYNISIDYNFDEQQHHIAFGL